MNALRKLLFTLAAFAALAFAAAPAAAAGRRRPKAAREIR